MCQASGRYDGTSFAQVASGQLRMLLQECPRNIVAQGTSYAGHLQTVGQPVVDEYASREREHLRFVLQTSERCREYIIFVPQKQSFLHIMEVRVINKSHHPLPQYATSDSAGMDLRANLDRPIVLKPLERCLVPTGLYIALPHGTEAQIRPRSGLALKKGITVLNSPGTIDADYRGEICIILVNLSSEPFEIRDGERIAQMVVASYEQAGWKPVESLDETERGAGGFGHSGEK